MSVPVFSYPSPPAGASALASDIATRSANVTVAPPLPVGVSIPLPSATDGFMLAMCDSFVTALLAPGLTTAFAPSAWTQSPTGNGSRWDGLSGSNYVFTVPMTRPYRVAAAFTCYVNAAQAGQVLPWRIVWDFTVIATGVGVINLANEHHPIGTMFASADATLGTAGSHTLTIQIQSFSGGAVSVNSGGDMISYAVW